jgi:chemotaxis signal transduction protein
VDWRPVLNHLWGISVSSAVEIVHSQLPTKIAAYHSVVAGTGINRDISIIFIPVSSSQLSSLDISACNC